jgi:hypothetical protein
MSRSAAQKGRLIALAGCASLALAGAGALRADLMVSHGFRLALGAQKGGVSFETAAQGRQLQAEAGDEGYWLTRADVASASPFSKPLAIGDRITITDRDGRERHLQVVNLKAIGVPLFKVAAGAPARLLLVTCRDLDATGREGETLVRFIIESEIAEPTAVPQPAPKAL